MYSPSASAANFDVVNAGVLIAQKPTNKLAIGTEDKHTDVGTGVDQSGLIHDNSAVGRTEDRSAVGSQPPTGDGFEGHAAVAHANRFSRFFGDGCQRALKNE
jgi:hypothetical protein